MPKRLAAAIVLILIAAGAYAQRGGGTSVDLFYLAGTGSINRATAGVSLSSSGQTVSNSIKNLILLLAGQSNCADLVPSAYTPSNPTKIDQLNVFDGAIRVASDPLIGTSYFPTLGPGNAYLRVADTLITNGKFDRVILVPLCVGSTKVSDWAPGGFYQDEVTVAMRRLAANGIVAGTNVTFAAIWAQGESDTDAATSQASYTTSLNAFITATRTAGFAGIWFVNVQSRSVGVTSANVTAAQAAVVNHGSSIWAGANADALSGATCSASACRQADDTHWSNAGAASIAAATVTAMGLSGAPF